MSSLDGMTEPCPACKRPNRPGHRPGPADAAALAICLIRRTVGDGTPGILVERANTVYHPGTCRWCRYSAEQLREMNTIVLAHNGGALKEFDYSEFARLAPRTRWARIREAQEPDMLDALVGPGA